jgi:long-chain fatty acid transport protein
MKRLFSRITIAPMLAHLCALAFTGGALWAGGPGEPMTGLAPLGSAGAWVARAEDSSALFLNPAGLVRGSRSLQLTLPYSSQQTTYSTVGSSEWLSKGAKELLPGFVYSDRFGKVALAAGTAVTGSYGHEFEGTQFPGRFISSGMEVEIREYALAAAIQLPARFSLGFGLRQLEADGSWQRHRIDAYSIGLDTPQLYESLESLNGSGDALAFSLGLQYYPNRRFNLGLAYQSGKKIQLQGAQSFQQLTRRESSLAVQDFENRYQEGTFATELQWPARLAAGFTFRTTVRTRVEIDLEQESWSDLQETRLATSSGDWVIPRDWRDVYTLRAGADFQQRKSLVWRAGIAGSRSAVPSSTIEPGFPDADRFHYSFGCAMTFGRLTLEAGYLYQQFRDRHASNQEQVVSPGEEDYLFENGQRGLYETQRHFLALGLSYRF